MDITFLRVKMDTDPLIKISGLNVIDEKNMVGRRDYIKGGPSSL